MTMPSNDKNRLIPPAELCPIVDEALYESLEPYVESAKALARLTYKSLYIIDYHKMNFLYVSSNPLFLCGKSAEEVMREGYQFYYDHVPEEDLAFLKKVNEAGFAFFTGIAPAERTEYAISYNFRISTESENLLLVNHQLTPLRLDAMGNMWLSLCLVSLAHTEEVGTAYISALGSDKRWQLSPASGQWKQFESITLSEHEKEVISLANRGLSVGEIADTMHRSEDSVKGYRKTLFQKLGVSNISEAIAVATHRRLV